LAIAGLGVTEWIRAVKLLKGDSRPSRWPYAVAAGGTIATVVWPGYPLTALIISVTLGALYLGTARAAAKIRLQIPSVGRAVLVTVFAAIGLIMVSRVVLFFASSGSGAAPGFTSTARAVMFIAVSAGPFAGSLGFVLTCGEKLGHRLLFLSLTDPLTKIPNRRAFLDSLRRSIAIGSRRSEPVAVLVLDVDHFKQVNDAAGHAAGDEVLVEVAKRLAEASRSEDAVARIGGEEFGVVQSGVGLDDAAAAAERLREAIVKNPITVDGRSFTLSVSIGVAATSGVEESPSQLLARADKLMYVAKSRGRNQVAKDASC